MKLSSRPFIPVRLRPAGFTLIELLVVMVIILILAVGLVPAATSIMRGYQLTASTDSLVSNLMLARQNALTRGAAVQVRLYQLPDYNQPSSSAPAVYRGLQAFVEGDPVAGSTNVPLTPLTRPVYFKNQVVVLADTSVSTVLGLTPSTGDTNTVGDYRSNYKYISFRFKPNGQTDLSDTNNCLSLVLQNDPVVSQGLPANFRTIKIGSPSGVVQTYKP